MSGRVQGLLAALLGGMAALAGGCREIPPSIPRDYAGGPVAPGWPPLAVYRLEPLHPWNRWFQRTFSGRDARGGLLPVHADEPFGAMTSLAAVDAAELAALLEECGREEEAEPNPLLAGGDGRAALAEEIFRADLLAEAARLRAEAAPQAELQTLIPLLLRRARSRRPPGGELALGLEAEPPPLRTGRWLEVAPAAGAPGLLPSPADIRWTRALVEEPLADSPPRRAILRLRSALGPEGEPRLLPLASECWVLEVAGGSPAARVWRFDRAEWLHGREPWRELPGEAIMTIRDPLDAGGRRLAGRLDSLCLSCHGDDGKERVRQPAPTALPDVRSSQRLLVARALAAVSSGR